MLQRIREHTTGWFAWVVIALIIFAMAFFGIEHYFQARVDTYAAKIESAPSWWRDAPSEGATGRLARSFLWETHEISEDDFRERFDRYRQQMREQAGDQYDVEQVESIETKRLVLDAMIDEEILKLAAARDGIAIDASQVRDAILEVEGITQDGEFIGEDAYLIWLQSRGLTAAGFEAQVAEQLKVSKLPQAIGASGMVGASELEALLALQAETRDLRYVEIPLPAPDDAAIDDAALAAWHEANAARYSTEETVTVSYVELDAATLAVATAPTEDELRQRYESQRTRFGTEEQRTIAHILVEVAPGADEATVNAARAEAGEIAALARAEGADFAALATQRSDDIGTRDQGGDLGIITRGVFPADFESAAFALPAGGVSDPVRTDGGWHVLKVTDLVEASVLPFEAVRAQLEAEFGDSERERLFNERSGALVDAILREPNSITAVAADLGLEVRSAGPFTRATGEGVAAVEAVREVAFSRTQKDDRVVSDPVEVGSNRLLVLQVSAHSPAALRPLAEVREQVFADLAADRLAKAARERADALLARARGGESLEAIATGLGAVPQESLRVSRQAGLPDPAIVAEAFRLEALVAGQAADVGLASLGNGRYALVVATRITAGDLSTLTPAVRAQLQAQLAQLRGSAERDAFVRALRSQFEITVAEQRL
ncbi:MAG TPA: peptidylprolyl isomerase [Xanthomonadaceae bacterium]|nr:peptidylprolyl isomerase [Xanthomonadaceae bacterium]